MNDVASPTWGGDGTSGDGVGGEGDGDCSFSAGGPTYTSKGNSVGMGATTPTTTSCCPTSTSSSDTSSKYSSYCSILQQKKSDNETTTPLALIPIPVSDDFVISHYSCSTLI